jgi:UDP-N-acetylmuramyl pentapeptide synthase
VAVAISCGGLADLALDRASAAGVAVHRAASVQAAAEIAVRVVEAGDAVLVKGSRSIGTERVVEALVADRGGTR